MSHEIQRLQAELDYVEYDDDGHAIRPSNQIMVDRGDLQALLNRCLSYNDQLGNPPIRTIDPVVWTSEERILEGSFTYERTTQ